MSTSKVIFNIPTKIKLAAARRAAQEGLTLTAVFTQAAQAYGDGAISMKIVETPTLRPIVARRLDARVDDYFKGRHVTAVSAKAVRSTKRKG